MEVGHSLCVFVPVVQKNVAGQAARVTRLQNAKETEQGVVVEIALIHSEKLTTHTRGQMQIHSYTG